MKDRGSSSTVITAAFGGMRRIDDAASEWVLKNRNISRETLERLNVGCGTAFFGDAGKQLPCVMFPYDGGGWKARSYPDKYFTSQKDMKVTFWGLRDVLNGPLDRVYIVEGEFDRCALVEAGISPDRVLAAPGATKGEVQYAKDALKDGLSKCKQFVLCVDQDGPGTELRQRLVSVFGVARSRFVDWPDGTKDANDLLRTDGPQALRDLVEDGSLMWPAEGLFTMSRVPAPAELDIWYPGFDNWGRKLMLAPGMMSVVTGHPGHGKTALWAQIWFQIALAYDLVMCVATFETRPKPHYQKILRQLHARCPLLDTDGNLIMPRNLIAAADAWIEDRYRFIIHAEERPTLRWMLDQAEIAVVRDGAKVLQIDPWNRLEAQKDSKESDTDYIRRCLLEAHAFANDLKVHVQILAHPSKMEGNRRGALPELEDIAGSKHWENMIDQGFVVHRPRLYDDEGEMVRYAELHHKKCRFEQLGYPTKFGLEYDPDAGRYGTAPLAQKKPKKDAVKDARKPKDSDYDYQDEIPL